MQLSVVLWYSINYGVLRTEGTNHIDGDQGHRIGGQLEPLVHGRAMSSREKEACGSAALISTN